MRIEIQRINRFTYLICVRRTSRNRKLVIFRKTRSDVQRSCRMAWACIFRFPGIPVPLLRNIVSFTPLHFLGCDVTCERITINTFIMKEEIDLKLLVDYLSEDISPKELARLLDELAFDYSRINLQLQQLEEHIHMFHHPEAKDFLYHLKRLRDVLHECTE